MAVYSPLTQPGTGAYGTVPVGPPATSTAPTTVPQAIQLGNLAYSGLPGYQQSLNNIGNYISSTTAGQLPDDVLRQIQQRAAERGVATGSPGSPNANAAYLHDLGLNSLQLQGMGQQAFGNTLGLLPGAALSQNPGMYVNPNLQYESDLQRNIFASAPNPSMAGAASLGAARSGYGTGLGAISSPPNYAPGLPSSDAFMAQPWEAANAPAAGAYGYGTGGTYIGGQYYAPGESPMSGNRVNQILQSYAPGNTGGGTGQDYSGEYNPDPLGQGFTEGEYNFGSQYDYNTDPYWGLFGEGE